MKKLIVFDFDGVIADSETLANAALAEFVTSLGRPMTLQASLDAFIYSASLVKRGKPHPDIYLHVARQLDADPADALVIEDSVGGVRAAVAAGMTTVGLLAGSHIRPAHEEHLRCAGAHYIARTYDQVADITRRLIGY